MNFDRTDEQVALQDVIARFCAERFPLSEARHWGEPGGFDRARWEQLASVGVFELADPLGGTGSLVDAALAYEELGRALVPGPVVAAGLSAGFADGVGSGDHVAVVVDRDAAPMMVPHLGDADVVLALAGDGVARVDPAAVRATRIEDGLDPTASVWLVDDLPAGDRVGDGDLASQCRATGSLLVAALLLGIGIGAMERAAAYAKDRFQFGRPIGSFQAVKHLLADCFARVELGRAAVYAAAVSADDRKSGDAVRAAAGARYLATRAAVDNAKTGIQVFGGMGFTWEADAHLFLKRAWSLQSTLGSVDDSLDTLAARLG